MRDTEILRVEDHDRLYLCQDGSPMMVDLTEDNLLCKKCGLSVDEHGLS